MSDIQNKVVVITGASSGLGESTARLLGARGAKVFLGARREENLKGIAQEMLADRAKSSQRLPVMMPLLSPCFGGWTKHKPNTRQPLAPPAADPVPMVC